MTLLLVLCLVAGCGFCSGFFVASFLTAASRREPKL